MGSEISTSQISPLTSGITIPPPIPTIFVCEFLESDYSVQVIVRSPENLAPIKAGHLPPLFRLKPDTPFEELRDIEDGGHRIMFEKSGQPKIMEIDDVSLVALRKFTNASENLRSVDFVNDNVDECIHKLELITENFRYYEYRPSLEDLIGLLRVKDDDSLGLRVDIVSSCVKRFIDDWFPETLCMNENCFGSCKWVCSVCKKYFCGNECCEEHECVGDSERD